MSSYSQEYRRNRAALMEMKQPCHWCGRTWDRSFQADHLLERDAGGDDSLHNLVSSCAPCNQKRGQRYKTRKENARIKARNDAMNAAPGRRPETPENAPEIVFRPDTRTPSMLLGALSPKVGTGDSLREIPGNQLVLPRLETVRSRSESLGPAVVEWAARHLGIELLPWQCYALDGLLELDDDGDLANRSGYLSVARQNGKTVLGQAVLGFWITELARRRGKPQTVVNTAAELSLACQQFERVAPVLKETFGFTLKWGYGRMEAKGPDGSRWYVKAGTPAAPHGLSCDLVWADEIWNMSDEVLASGWRQTMKARNRTTAGGSPLMLMTSTAGTQASTAQLRYREQGLKLIDEGRPGKFYFAEWSISPGADPMDTSLWAQANPSLGTLIQLDDLLVDAQHPDRISFLRGGLNLFVDADAAWLQPGEWAACQTDEPFPDAGPIILAVDSSLDDSRYLGLEAGVDQLGRIHLRPAFQVATLRECQEELLHRMENPQVKLAITPTLEAHVPPHLEKRKTIVGYGELLKWTSLAKSLILEKRVCHAGEESLAEHMNRAVAVRQQHAVALSSKRSPGPIELARLAIFATGIASRPRALGRAAMGTSR